MRTVKILPAKMERKWFLIDAKNKPLGKVAVKAASLLRGKHKPEFTPNYDIGDYVIVINAEKAVMTGRKADQKMYYRQSGYVGSLTAESYNSILARKPWFPMEHAIKGMLPHNRLGRQMFRHVKVFAGDQHPHVSQKPEKIGV